jgi:hypothetical protein
VSLARVIITLFPQIVGLRGPASRDLVAAFDLSTLSKFCAQGEVGTAPGRIRAPQV